MSRPLVVALAVLAGSALAGCGGSSSTVPVSSTPVVVAGEYAGPVTDSALGQETGDIVLAQHGTNLGGSMTLTAGTTSSVESVALSLSGSSVTGSGVLDVNGSACTFAITGSIANNTLAATYTAVSGCTRTGSWMLTQTCTGTAQADNRRTEGFVPRC